MGPRGDNKLANACDSSAGNYFHTANHYGVNGADYVDFIFTFDEANTWCSGYRQYGTGATHSAKDVEIYTGDANFGPWTKVATDSHSTWHNSGTPTFPDDGTTTEWTPTAPSKYLLVRTLTNHGDTGWGGRFSMFFPPAQVWRGAELKSTHRCTRSAAKTHDEPRTRRGACTALSPRGAY